MRKIWLALGLLTFVLFFGAQKGLAQNHGEGEDSVGMADTVGLVAVKAADPVVGEGFSGLATQRVQDQSVIKPVNLLRGLLGMVVLIAIAWVFSSNRRGVSWKVVISGLLIQVTLALGVLLVRPVQVVFETVGKIFVLILDFTRVGSSFLFGKLVDVDTMGAVFAFQILPTIVFFAALTSVLYYLGIIQKVVWVLAWMMAKAFRLSGAESLAVAGNIFLGQNESPLMVKAYLEKMNRSEILLIMVAGMATVAGGVMAAYIGFLGGNDPEQRLLFAKHLLAASVMAAPGAVVIAKILYPQDQPVQEKIEPDQSNIGDNLLDAINRGTIEGLKLAAIVGAMLLVFFAFIAMINYVLLKLGSWTTLNDGIAGLSNGRYEGFSLQFILGYLFSPLMWVIGVCPADMALVGQLAGEKLIASEFVGYTSLAAMKDAGIFAEDKSILMATYMLCGFANFASIGIQVGGIGSLAPGKKKWLTEFGMKALLGGTLASLMSATIVGMILG